MLNNLKALIRQGKQANDQKAKPVNGIDEYYTEAKQQQSHKEHQKSHQTQHREHQPAQAQSTETQQQTQSHQQQQYQEMEQQQTDQTLGSQQQQNDRHANQIFEQEKKDRSGKRDHNLPSYEFMEKMGEGAFSNVYKARNLKSGELVAIKVLRKYQMDSAQQQAVLKEVIIMRQLDHPNVVKFIEFVECDSYFYIVQELIGGGEVFGAIVNYTYLSEDLSRHIIFQVAKAVRYLHEEVGIVHRDIKPENVLFNPIAFAPSLNPISKLRRSDDPKTKKDEGDFVPGVGGGTIGVVKLADFGLSKQIWEQNTKTPCGTVGYTAPEIVRDERYSKEVDMWAIGCVLYTLLCGFPPFYDERIESLTEKVARGEFTFLAPWWDEISAEAKHCVSKLLTVDPKKRYTIDDFFEDPWMQKAVDPESMVSEGRKARMSNGSLPQYQNTDLYSPAASALREAFDISAAVHRMGEEAAYNRYEPVLEEEDEDESDEYSPPGKIPRDLNHQNGFALDLGGASILGRRKNKVMAAV